jgi:hypothetical protein
MYFVKSLTSNSASDGIPYEYLFTILNETEYENCKFKSFDYVIATTDEIFKGLSINKYTYCLRDIIELNSFKEILIEIDDLFKVIDGYESFIKTFFNTRTKGNSFKHLETTKQIVTTYYEKLTTEEKEECLPNLVRIINKLDFVIEDCKKNIVDLKEELKKVLISYYGDNFYIDGSHFVLHYPHIKIQNSLGKEHDIYDLFFKIDVDNHTPDNLYLNFYGCRTTLSDGERNNSYLHSHLNPSNSRGSYQNFCTGSGHMNDYRNIRNKDKLMSLPIAIDRYLEWESLEGGPYRHMSANYSNSHSHERIRSLTTSERHSILQKAILENAISLNIINNRVSINVRSNYIPDTHYVKIGNNAYITKDVPQNTTLKETISFSKVEGRMNLTNANGQIVTFYYKKVNIPQTNSSKAEVKNFFETLDLTNYVSSDTIIQSILNKATNELIEFK